MAASLLFKHKVALTLFFTGAGAGIGGANFVHDLRAFRNKRNWQGQDQNLYADQGRFNLLDEQTRGNVQQAKQSAKEGVEDLSKLVANKVNQTAKGVDNLGQDLSNKTMERIKKNESSIDNLGRENQDSSFYKGPHYKEDVRTRSQRYPHGNDQNKYWGDYVRQEPTIRVNEDEPSKHRPSTRKDASPPTTSNSQVNAIHE